MLGHGVNGKVKQCVNKAGQKFALKVIMMILMTMFLMMMMMMTIMMMMVSKYEQSMKQLCVLQRAIMSQPMDDKTVRRIVKCFLRQNIKCFLRRNMKCFLSANQPTLADKTKDDDFLCTCDTILRFGDAEYLGENPETNIILR